MRPAASSMVLPQGPSQVLPMGGGSINSAVAYDAYGAQPGFTSFVGQPQGPPGHSMAQPGDAWESGGCRYRMGDRYLMDGQGNQQTLVHGDASPGGARGLSPARSFVGQPQSNSFVSAGYGGGYG